MTTSPDSVGSVGAVNPAFAPVDFETADLEMNRSIYEGFSTAIMVRGQPRTVALCREYSDAVQFMAMLETAKATTALVIQLHAEGVLSEGQVAAATGLDRVDIRTRVDALSEAKATATPSAMGSGDD